VSLSVQFLIHASSSIYICLVWRISWCPTPFSCAQHQRLNVSSRNHSEKPCDLPKGFSLISVPHKRRPGPFRFWESKLCFWGVRASFETWSHKVVLGWIHIISYHGWLGNWKQSKLWWQMLEDMGYFWDSKSWKRDVRKKNYFPGRFDGFAQLLLEIRNWFFIGWCPGIMNSKLNVVRV